MERVSFSFTRARVKENASSENAGIKTDSKRIKNRIYFFMLYFLTFQKTVKSIHAAEN